MQPPGAAHPPPVAHHVPEARQCPCERSRCNGRRCSRLPAPSPRRWRGAWTHSDRARQATAPGRRAGTRQPASGGRRARGRRSAKRRCARRGCGRRGSRGKAASSRARGCRRAPVYNPGRVEHQQVVVAGGPAGTGGAQNSEDCASDEGTPEPGSPSPEGCTHVGLRPPDACPRKQSTARRKRNQRRMEATMLNAGLRSRGPSPT